MKRIKTLKMNYEFKNVFSKGKYYIGKQVIVYFLNNRLGYNRIGIAISSKLCKAVKRNSIKRLIRASYQRFCFTEVSSYDIVFIWNKKANIEDASFEIISKDLNKAFLKFGIIK